MINSLTPLRQRQALAVETWMEKQGQQEKAAFSSFRSSLGVGCMWKNDSKRFGSGIAPKASTCSKIFKTVSTLRPWPEADPKANSFGWRVWFWGCGSSKIQKKNKRPFYFFYRMAKTFSKESHFPPEELWLRRVTALAPSPSRTRTRTSLDNRSTTSSRRVVVGNGLEMGQNGLEKETVKK